jgi:hypothetical protein
MLAKGDEEEENCEEGFHRFHAASVFPPKDDFQSFYVAFDARCEIIGIIQLSNFRNVEH